MGGGGGELGGTGSGHPGQGIVGETSGLLEGIEYLRLIGGRDEGYLRKV